VLARTSINLLNRWDIEGDGHDLIGVLPRHLPRRKEKSDENAQDYRCLDRNSNPIPPEY
jgi:hypothetical protein